MNPCFTGRLLRTVCFVSFFVVMTPLSLLAENQESAVAGVAGKNDDEQYTLALNGADIKELIHWAQQFIDKNIVVHSDVRGTVTVLAGAPFGREEAYDIFLSVLASQGLTAVDNGKVLEIMPSQQSKQANFPLVDSTEGRPGAQTVVRILKIKNVSAQKVVETVKPLISSDALISAYPQTNLVILSDRASNMDRILSIIERIDHAGSFDIEAVAVQYASAKDIAQTISSLLTTTGGGVESRDTGLGFSITTDERSNTLLMTGDPVIRQRVRALIHKLDQPVTGDGNTQVIYLDFVNAKTLVPILNSIAASQQKASKDQAFTATEIKIEVSEENNALIVSAPPAVLSSIKSVIAKLDVRRAQVLVESVVVEVNDELAKDLGIEWRTNISRDGTFVGGSTNSANLTTPAPPSLGPGMTLGFYSNDELRGFIRALETDAGTNILSRPTVVTLDNEEAEILIGENVPFITGSSTGPSSGTENPFQTIQRQDIGITLKVKPRINNENSVTLDIKQTVEAISSSSVATADIVTSKRAINTKVLIENDEVLVLGGLIRDELVEKKSKVPLLGDIPWLGRLFRSTSNQSIKKNLMVFIHPVVIRDSDIGRDISHDRYQDFRRRQNDFNNNLDSFFAPKNRPQLPPLPDTAPKAADETDQKPVRVWKKR